MALIEISGRVRCLCCGTNPATSMTPIFEWLSPWYSVSEEETSAGLARQLAIEVGKGHVLEGLSVRVLARRSDTDDALFALPDGRIAEVHMTWRQSAETEPHWPATAIFASLEKWAADSMRPLHDELQHRD